MRQTDSNISSTILTNTCHDTNVHVRRSEVFQPNFWWLSICDYHLEVKHGTRFSSPWKSRFLLETIIFKYHVELPHLCPHPARCFMQLDDILKLLRWGVFWGQGTGWMEHSARSTSLRQLRPSTVLYMRPLWKLADMDGFFGSVNHVYRWVKTVDFCRVREAAMRVGVSFI